MTYKLDAHQIQIVPFTAEHLSITYEWMHDIEITTPFLFQAKITTESHRAWFENVKHDKTQSVFAIIINNETHVGNVGLKNINIRNKSPELWIYIGNRSFQNLSIAKHAILKILDIAKSIFAIHEIYVNVSSTNSAALHLYKRCGFCNEKLLTKHQQFNGQLIDIVRMSIVLNNYKRNKFNTTCSAAI